MNKYKQKIMNVLSAFLKDPLFLRRWEMSGYTQTQNDNRLSIQIDYHNSKRDHHNSGEHLFVRDYHTIFLCNRTKKKVSCNITPTSSEKERVIANGISNYNHPRSLTDALCNFIETANYSLFKTGVAMYEVVYEKDYTGNITNFSFEHLDPVYIFHFFGNYYQVVPWWVAKKNHIRAQIIKIPANKILHIEFSRELGGKRKLRNIFKRLYKLKKEPIPNFQKEAIEKNENIGFNLDEFKKTQYLEIAKLTANLGWNQRQTSEKYITEYYWFLRELKKMQAQAIVRKEILKKLNDFLNGPILNFGITLAIQNLPTKETIQEQEELMSKGDIRFTDIRNAIST